MTPSTSTPEVRVAYLRLGRSLIERDRTAAGRALVELGFIDEGDDPGAMVDVFDIIFEPAYQDRDYDPREYNSVERAMSAAALKLENRMFNSPAHSVFLMRALVGLDSYLQQFGTVTNYHRLFAECVAQAEERTGSKAATAS